MEVASGIFYSFIKDINDTKRKVSKEIYEEFKKGVEQGTNVFATENMIKSANKYYDTQLKKNLSGLQSINNSLNTLPIYDLDLKLVEKSDDTTNIIMTDITELDKLSLNISSVKTDIKNKIKQYQDTLKTYPKDLVDKFNLETFENGETIVYFKEGSDPAYAIFKY